MTVSSVVDIVDGRLATDPAIGTVEEIRTKAAKVSRGDVYIALEGPEALRVALAQGAYAVITGPSMPVSDPEVAWIVVDDLAFALTALIRFVMLSRGVKGYSCNASTLFILKQICRDRRVAVQPAYMSLESRVEMLLAQEVEMCVSDDTVWLETILPKAARIGPADEIGLDVIKKSPFEMTFAFRGIGYTVPLSGYFLPFLTEAMYVCMTSGMGWRFPSQWSNRRIYPLYFDRFFRLSESSRAAKVVIVDERVEAHERAQVLGYFRHALRWGQVDAVFKEEMAGTLSDRLEAGKTLFLYAGGFSVQEVMDAAGVVAQKAPKNATLFGF